MVSACHSAGVAERVDPAVLPPHKLDDEQQQDRTQKCGQEHDEPIAAWRNRDG